MPGELIEKDLGWFEILRELDAAASADVTVGIHHDASVEEDGTPTAVVGAVHEFGTDRVPARPWLGTTIDEHEGEIAKMADKLYFGPILEGKATTRQALGLIGQRAEDLVKNTVRESRSDWAPLAESTKQQKARTLGGAKHASFVGGDGNPLVDTGQMLNSIRYKVET